MSNPEVPMYAVPSRGEIFGHNGTNPTGFIEDVLNEPRAPSFIAAGEHEMLALTPTKPHTPNGHGVGWVKHRHEPAGELSEYTSPQWEEIAHDAAFLDTVDQIIRIQQSESEDTRAYAVIGYVPVTHRADGVTTSRGLQSLRRPHWHFTNGLNGVDEPVRILNAQDEVDQRRFAFFSNRAGELSIQTYSFMAGLLGTKHTFYQQVGVDGNTELLPRTMYRPASLADGLQAGFELTDHVRDVWLEHAEWIAQQTVMFGEHEVGLKQTPVPSLSILYPSQSDMEALGMAEPGPYIMPFAVCGPQQVMQKGGAVFA